MGAWPRLISIGLPLFAIVGCDHATKYVAKAELDGSAPRPLIRGVLELRYAENTDIGFGLLRWIPESARFPLLIAFGALTLAALALVLYRMPGPPLARLALASVFAGGVGNYLDRVVRGYVVDFIHVAYWPVFNVADVAIVVGGVGLAVMMIKQPPAAPA